MRSMIGMFVLLLSAAVAPALAGGPPPADLAKMLARPLSPGVMGLLIEHTDDPAARERLTAGLADTNPQTRAAAARVIYARGLVAMKPAVANALATETDESAAVEMIGALGVDLQSFDIPAIVKVGKGLSRHYRDRAAVAVVRAHAIPPYDLLKPLARSRSR